MLEKALAQTSRITSRRGTRVGSIIPRPTPSRNILAPSAVHPVLEPVHLELTPALKKGRWDPPAANSVVVLDPTVFKHPIRRDILHLCVNHYRDSLRQGSANTKTRGEVRGSGAKLYRQKGTGKARVGDGQSPIRRGGGIAFGPKPRDFSTKLPRKVIEMGMRVVLSSKLRDARLGVMTRLQWPNAKTNTLSKRVEALGLRKTLFVTGESEVHEGLVRAINNIPDVDVIKADETNVYELLRWPRLVLDLKAVEYFESILKKNIPVQTLPELPAATQTSEAQPVVS